VTAHLTGYIRVNAESLDQAKSLLVSFHRDYDSLMG